MYNLFLEQDMYEFCSNFPILYKDGGPITNTTIWISKKQIGNVNWNQIHSKVATSILGLTYNLTIYFSKIPTFDVSETFENNLEIMGEVIKTINGITVVKTLTPLFFMLRITSFKTAYPWGPCKLSRICKKVHMHLHNKCVVLTCILLIRGPERSTNQAYSCSF